MIAYLKGKILKKTEKTIILEIGGTTLPGPNQTSAQFSSTTSSPISTSSIGYLVQLPATLLAQTAESQTLELFIHSNIREDAFDLYGFANYSDLTFFKTLLSVSGIGPKTGLEIMNGDTAKIKLAILNEDHAYICKVPGIGQKTAKRMILELKSKIEMDDLSGLENSANKSGNTSSDPHPDAIDALLRLGYQRHQVTKTLREMPTTIIEAEEIISYFLKNV